MTPYVVLIPVAVAIIVITIVGHLYRKHKQRIEDLRREAGRLKFSFDDEGTVHANLEHFHIFSQGRARKSRNIMRARATDLGITIFDYQYTTGSGKHAHTRRHTIVFFEAQNERIPAFSLRPEHLFHKIGQVFGYHDIDFESHPAFSKGYLLRGADESLVRATFTPQVLDYFETVKGVGVEASAGQLVYYPTGKPVRATELEKLLHDAVQTYALFTA